MFHRISSYDSTRYSQFTIVYASSRPTATDVYTLLLLSADERSLYLPSTLGWLRNVQRRRGALHHSSCEDDALVPGLGENTYTSARSMDESFVRALGNL